jgi:hypothetical protein
MGTMTIALKSLIMQRINKADNGDVWTPTDFVDVGTRDAIDKALQRLATNHELRRISRGLYDRPQINKLTGKLSVPNYQKIIDAIVRRDEIRILMDGLTCANELGLTHAVLGKVMIHTDGRLRPIRLENLTIRFKLTTPSKLYWAERPGMRIVQALYWLHASFKGLSEVERKSMQDKLTRILQDPKQGKTICADLQNGLHTMPIWMQKWIQKLLSGAQEKQ